MSEEAWVRQSQINAEIDDIEEKIASISDPLQRKSWEDRRDELLRELDSLQTNN